MRLQKSKGNTYRLENYIIKEKDLLGTEIDLSFFLSDEWDRQI